MSSTQVTISSPSARCSSRSFRSNNSLSPRKQAKKQTPQRRGHKLPTQGHAQISARTHEKTSCASTAPAMARIHDSDGEAELCVAGVRATPTLPHSDVCTAMTAAAAPRRASCVCHEEPNEEEEGGIEDHIGDSLDDCCPRSNDEERGAAPCGSSRRSGDLVCQDAFADAPENCQRGDMAASSDRPTYAAVLTKRLPRSRTGVQRQSSSCRTVYPHLFIDIPARTSSSQAASPLGAHCADLAHSHSHTLLADADAHAEEAKEGKESDCGVAPCGLNSSSCVQPCHAPLSAGGTVPACQSRHPAPRGAFGAVEVIPGLFLGANADAANTATLREHNVSLVLNVAAECTISSEQIRNRDGVRYVHLPLKDHSDEVIAPYLLPIAQIIHAQLHRRALFQRHRDARTQQEQQQQQQPHKDSDDDVEDEEAVLLSPSAVTGHPRQKETRHETPRSPSSLLANAAGPASGSRASSCVVSPISPPSHTSPAGPHAAILAQPRHQRFSPTFPAAIPSVEDEDTRHDAAPPARGQPLASPLPAASTCSALEHSSPTRVRRPSCAMEDVTGTDSSPRISTPDRASSSSLPNLDESECGGVLVHCRMGVSRSASFVMAYLVLFGKAIEDVPPDSAVGRWVCRPGWAEEEAQLLAILQSELAANADLTTTTTASSSAVTEQAGKSGTMTTPSSRRTSRGVGTVPLRGGSLRSAGTPTPPPPPASLRMSSPTTPLRTFHYVVTHTGGTPYCRAWFTPMSPLSPQVQKQITHTTRAAQGPLNPFQREENGVEGSSDAIKLTTGQTTTTATNATSARHARVLSEMSTSQRSALSSPQSAHVVAGARSLLSPTSTSTSISSPLWPSSNVTWATGPREIAMGFCEPCFLMRCAAAATASASSAASTASPTPTTATTRSGGNAGCLSSENASSPLQEPRFRRSSAASTTLLPPTSHYTRVQSLLRSPLTTTTTTPTPSARLPALDVGSSSNNNNNNNSSFTNKAASAVVREGNESTQTATTTAHGSSERVGDRVVAISDAQEIPVASPTVHHVIAGTPTANRHTPLSTATTTTTTTMLPLGSPNAAAGFVPHKERPHLQIEPLSHIKAAEAFSSSFLSASQASMSSAGPPLCGSGLTYAEAFHFLKSRKSNVNPNIGFVLALRDLAGGMGDGSFSLSASMQDR